MRRLTQLLLIGLLAGFVVQTQLPQRLSAEEVPPVLTPPPAATELAPTPDPGTATPTAVPAPAGETALPAPGPTDTPELPPADEGTPAAPPVVPPTAVPVTAEPVTMTPEFLGTTLPVETAAPLDGAQLPPATQPATTTTVLEPTPTVQPPAVPEQTTAMPTTPAAPTLVGESDTLPSAVTTAEAPPLRTTTAEASPDQPPTATVVLTATPEPTHEPAPSPTGEPAPSPSALPEPEPTPGATLPPAIGATAEPTHWPTATPSPTEAAAVPTQPPVDTATPSATASRTAVPSETATPADTAGLIATALPTPTHTPTAGPLTISGGEAPPFPPLRLTGMPQQITVQLGGFAVSDMRGTGEGWRVMVQATRMSEIDPRTGAYVGGGKQLAPGSLRLAAPQLQSAEPIAHGLRVVPGPYVIDAGAPVTIVQAPPGSGMGRVSFGPTSLTLSVPVNAYARTYHTELVLSVIAGP